MLVRILVWFLLKDTFLFFLGHLAFVLLQSSLQMFIFFFSLEIKQETKLFFFVEGRAELPLASKFQAPEQPGLRGQGVAALVHWRPLDITPDPTTPLTASPARPSP